ncbi:gliding motility-associated C-terminal domain-containing protein [Crocinitomix catalasitica]|nr:gliding motility-associated C-terminal domain-containing protein [Crocinitomix catalasitica]
MSVGPMAFSQANVQTIEITNIFTPGGDGINDIYKINAVGFDDLDCSIYNRHGELVYRFFGVEGGWDGFTHAGIRCSSGVYFAVIVLSNADGTVEQRQTTIQLLWE